ncbi:hypothetical protein Hdeb2414_s0033g00721861 [Helianthus debilis subsp. tardiflorus]
MAWWQEVEIETAGGYHKDAGGDSDKRCDDEFVEVDNRRRPSAITTSLLGFLFSQEHPY